MATLRAHNLSLYDSVHQITKRTSADTTRVFVVRLCAHTCNRVMNKSPLQPAGFRGLLRCVSPAFSQ